MDTNNTNTSSSTNASPASTPISPTPAESPNPLASTPSIPLQKPDFSSQPSSSAGIPQPQPESVPTTASAPTPPSPPAEPVIPDHSHKNKSMIWVIILLVFAFLCGIFLAAWYFQTQVQNTTSEKASMQMPVETPEKIIIGTDATYQPMEYVASDGALMGYDIDLGNKIGEEFGAQVEFKNIPWDDLFKALEARQIDIIMSAVTITEERQKQYDFSESYLNAGQVILTRKENTTINSAQTLQGKKIAVQEGTTNEKEALKHTLPSLVVRYPDFVQATKALVEGKADAILSDLPAAKGIVLAYPTLKIASDPLTNEYYGIVFRKNDPSVKRYNDVLSSLRTKGILTDLKQKWLD